MASIIRDGSAPLWRPDLYRIFSLLSVTQTPVTMRTSLSVNGGEPVALVLTGTIVAVDGLECELTINSVEFPDNAAFHKGPSCEYSAILSSNVGGRPQLVEYSGHARIHVRVDDEHGLPSELRMHFSLPAKVRPLRRHQRKPCDAWDIMPGLALLDGELRSRRQLLALMRHYYNKKSASAPQLVNISAGGVCLRTEDAIARRLMHATDRYLFFFFLRSPLEEKVPWVFLGRKAGAFNVSGAAASGLRIQFMRELCWEKSQKELFWSSIAAQGSQNLGRVLDGMRSKGDCAENMASATEAARPEA